MRDRTKNRTNKLAIWGYSDTVLGEVQGDGVDISECLL